MTLAERLVYAREHSGLSIAQACKIIGISRSTLYRWETMDDDHTDPSIDECNRLANIYGVSECFLLTGTLNTNVRGDFALLLSSKLGQAKADLEEIINLLSTLDYGDNE